MILSKWLLLIWYIKIVVAETSPSETVEVFKTKITVEYSERNKHKLEKAFPKKKISERNGCFFFSYTTNFFIHNNSFLLRSGESCYCTKNPCFDRNVPVINNQCNYVNITIGMGYIESDQVVFQRGKEMISHQIKDRISNNVWSTSNDKFYISRLPNSISTTIGNVDTNVSFQKCKNEDQNITNTNKKISLSPRASFNEDEVESTQVHVKTKNKKFVSTMAVGIIGFLVSLAAISVLIFGGAVCWNRLVKSNDQVEYTEDTNIEKVNNNREHAFMVDNNYYNPAGLEDSFNSSKLSSEHVYSEVYQSEVENCSLYNQLINPKTSNSSSERVYTVPYSHSKPALETSVSTPSTSEYAYVV